MKLVTSGEHLGPDNYEMLLSESAEDILNYYLDPTKWKWFLSSRVINGFDISYSEVENAIITNKWLDKYSEEILYIDIEFDQERSPFILNGVYGDNFEVYRVKHTWTFQKREQQWWFLRGPFAQIISTRSISKDRWTLNQMQKFLAKVREDLITNLRYIGHNATIYRSVNGDSDGFKGYKVPSFFQQSEIFQFKVLRADPNSILIEGSSKNLNLPILMTIDEDGITIDDSTE